MKRRILSILLIFCMCMTILPQGVVTVSAAEEEYTGQTGLGTYTISTADQLKTLAENVNNGTSYAGTTFKLTEEIDLSKAGYGESNSWTPIGTESKPFSGIFDGDSHTIEGLAINLSENSNSIDSQGLFGCVKEGTIQNLTVKGKVTTVGNRYIYVGGIVGYNKNGTVENCRSEVPVKVGQQTSSTQRIYIGGIVGYNNDGGRVENCRNQGDVEINASNKYTNIAGGIVGQDYEGTVTNCRNQGNVTGTGEGIFAGGIVGENNTPKAPTAIKNCWNEGKVTGTHAGGIMGRVMVSNAGGIQAEIENCWNKGAVTGKDRAGGILAYNDQENASIKNCGNQGKVAAGNYAGGILAGPGNLGNETTIINCYYLSGTANQGIYGKDDAEWDVKAKTKAEFESGEVTWLLQGEQESLFWAQQLGADDFPRLAYFMEGDEDAKEEKRVLKVAFYNATNATTYAPYAPKPYPYINKGATVQDAGGAEVSSQEYPAAAYEMVWLDRAKLTGNTYSGTIFGKDTPIEKETEFALFYKELFSGEDAALTASSGTAETKDLDKCMKYAGNGDAAGNFTYEITAGNDTLKASIKDNVLTVPAAATKGSYELTITATEKTAQMKNQKDSVTVTGTDSTTFTLSVTVGKSAEELLEQAKEVVKKVLDEMNVSNETTKEDIQDAIDAALKEAGLEDVKATVGDDFNKTEASAESKGQITGTVTLETGETKSTLDLDLEIPEDIEKGNVETETQSGEGAPEVELPMEKEEMANAVFTEEEWKEIDEGKDIKILLTVDNIEEDKVSAEEVQKIEKGAAYYTVGQYLDIELLKVVTDKDQKEERSNITTTNQPIRIVIFVPDSLKGDGSKVRTYAVVRLHDGETTLLEDQDNDPDTITIETDRFSTYAMVYTELTDEDRVAGAEEKLGEILKGLTITNDMTKEDIEKQIHDKLAEEGYGDVTVNLEITGREAATSEKEGKLTGNVMLTKGDANSQTMPLEAVIAKEPETPSSASPSVKPSEKPQPTPTVTPGAIPTVTPGATPTAKPNQNNDDDKYQKVGLISELKVTQKGKKIQVEWGKAADADGYYVYVQYCGKKFAQKATKTIRKSSITKTSIAKIGGKKLKLKKNFKVYVAAYKMLSGKRRVIKRTMTGHIVGKKNYKYTNAKEVKVKKDKITLQVGKTAQIKATTVRVDRKKKQLSNAHGQKYRYKSADESIATVSKSGKVTAVKKGSCNVYVFVQNGCAKEIKVAVK